METAPNWTLIGMFAVLGVAILAGLARSEIKAMSRRKAYAGPKTEYSKLHDAGLILLAILFAALFILHGYMSLKAGP